MKVLVHKFSLGDVDDPEIYAAQPIWEWQQTDAGKFVMEHSITEPFWERHWDHAQYNQAYRIVADLTEKDATFFQLKWGIK